MKKFFVVLVVLALVGISSMALAAEVTVGGTVQLRSRNFDTMSFDKNDNSKDAVDTQERIQIDVNAKADKVKGKIAIWNDFDTWGRFEQTQGTNINGTSTAAATTPNSTTIAIREAWVSFDLPFAPVNVTGGHLSVVAEGGFEMEDA